MRDVFAFREADCTVTDEGITCDLRRTGSPYAEVTINGNEGSVEIDAESGSHVHYSKSQNDLTIKSRGMQGASAEDGKVSAQFYP